MGFTCPTLAVDVKQAKPYLCFILDEKGIKASIDNAAVMARTDREWRRISSIKSVINNPIVSQFGWLKVGVVLLKAIIPSILMYSCEVWADSPKYVIDNLEASFCKMIYSVLDFLVNFWYHSHFMKCKLKMVLVLIYKYEL